ncbi:MAG TPA: endolytic transglycosylase MltG [Candidatus Paceibacterota bacterium]
MVKYLIFVFGVVVLGFIFLRPSSPSVVESNEIVITIPEGYTVAQMGELFEKSRLFSKEEFEKVAKNDEGFLFPDTYKFFKNTTPKKVVEKMKNNFNTKVAEFLPEIERQKKSLRDIIIMASIIEREVHNMDDRGLVSGILWKRIQKGIGLQVDASLTYILGKTSAELTADDLKIDSPYNTYKYRGLPKGPISNPGKEAIFAAVFPVSSSYLFYLSDKDGITHYAVDFEGHKLNKLRYLR